MGNCESEEPAPKQAVRHKQDLFHHIRHIIQRKGHDWVGKYVPYFPEEPLDLRLRSTPLESPHS